MRVLWIVPGPDSPSNMAYAKRALPALAQEGLEVRVFHLTSRSDPAALLKLWRQARSVVRDFQPDVVHAQYGSVAGVFGCLLGRPAAVTFRGSDVNRDPDLPLYRRPVSWAGSQVAALLARATVFVSEPLKRGLLYPGRTASCLPSPVDLDLFRPLPMAECRARLGLPARGKAISFVSVGGRALKRPELARAVCERLGARFLEVRGVEPSAIPLWLCASDCLLFTSLREGSPNAVREALACGVPTVTVDVGDAASWVARDPRSRVAASDSVSDLARAVVEVWDAPEPRLRRVDFSALSPSAHARALAALYRSCTAAMGSTRLAS